MMLFEAFSEAFVLIMDADADLVEILILSIHVSLSALFFSIMLALPIGTVLAITEFKGKKACVTVINTLMGLPPVVVGLLVYLALSRAGPLGVLGLLYTPTAMIIAQIIIVTPIIGALAHQVIDDLHREYRDLFVSLQIPISKAIIAYVWDARYSLLTSVLAGFGRAISEVGAVIIVGGNIDHLTRVMTTAIALETSKGELSIALALGMILLGLALIVNAVMTAIRAFAQRNAYV